jgi:hypothetical protein
MVLAQDADTPIEERDGVLGVTLFGIKPTQRVKTLGEAQRVRLRLGDLHRLSCPTLRPREIAAGRKRAGEIDERRHHGISDPALDRPAFSARGGGLEVHDRVP